MTRSLDLWPARHVAANARSSVGFSRRIQSQLLRPQSMVELTTPDRNDYALGLVVKKDGGAGPTS